MATLDTARKIFSRKVFDRTVLAMIGANFIVLGWGLVDDDHETLLANLDVVILSFFALEILVRIKAAGRRFYLDRWLLFDLAIILLALLPLGADALALRVTRAARLAHVSRHLPHVHHAFGLRALSWLARRIKGLAVVRHDGLDYNTPVA